MNSAATTFSLGSDSNEGGRLLFAKSVGDGASVISTGKESILATGASPAEGAVCVFTGISSVERDAGDGSLLP